MIIFIFLYLFFWSIGGFLIASSIFDDLSDNILTRKAWVIAFICGPLVLIFMIINLCSDYIPELLRDWLNKGDD